MKVKFLLIASLLSSVLFAGEWEKRELSYFDKIKVSGNIRVQLVQSDEPWLEIRDACCDMSDLKIEVDGSTLVINNDKGLIKDEEFDIIVHYPILRSLKAQVGANVKSKEWLESQFLKLTVTTGADVNLGIKAEELDLEATTGAMVYVDGSAERLLAVSNTGAVVEMDHFEAKFGDIKAHTGGVIETLVTERLKATAGTGGEIQNNGKPESTDIDTHLGGSVDCIRRSK
jgi:hypothetical protein